MTVYTATSLTSDETWNFISLPALARLLGSTDYHLAHDEPESTTRTVAISKADEHSREVLARVRVPAQACQPTAEGGDLGGLVHIRLGELLPKVDQWAAEHKVNRAEAVRELFATALAGARR